MRLVRIRRSSSLGAFPSRSSVLLLVGALAAVSACGQAGEGAVDDADAPLDGGDDSDAVSPDADADVDDGGRGDTDPGDTDPGDTDPGDTDPPDEGGDTDGGDAGGPDPALCDPIMPQSCAYPWPSNLYLAPDPGRVTGYTLRFGAETLPSNRGGQRVPPEPWMRLDGYGLGTAVLAILGDVDGTAFPDETRVAESLAADAPILLFEVRGGGSGGDPGEAALRRVPYWAEWGGRQPDRSLRTLVVRPGEVLREDTRYIVAFRGLRYRDGSPFERSPAFDALVRGATSSDPALAPRQARFDEVFGLLESAGVERASLSVAWDWHTASHEALHGPLVHMRDLAFAGPAPRFEITQVRRFAASADGSGLPVDARIAIEVEGTFTAPWFLQEEAAGARRGMVLAPGEDGLPRVVGERERPFWMMVPHSALGGEPHLLVQYGHGLLGTGAQVFGEYNRQVAADHGFVYFAAYMTGMSEEDVTSAMHTATDAGRFAWLADPLHQGLVEWALLARTFGPWIASQPLFVDNGIALADESPAYNGISQGGIFGLSFVALSPDVTRGHLGVPGSNYSILLERSLDFVPYFTIADISYPSRQEQMLLLSLVGLLWEATDPVSWVRHVSAEPLEGAPPSRVLLAPAKGDPEVAVVTNEVVGRTEDAGIPLMSGWGRDAAVETTADYPRAGSGVVLYDFGHPWPSPGIQPPSEYPELGDPHGLPKRSAHHNAQLAHFLWTGEIIDVCGGDGCAPD